VTRDQDEISERDAADWHALVLGGDVDWDAFAQWLDADPGNQPAYDRIAMLDAEVVETVRAGPRLAAVQEDHDASVDGEGTAQVVDIAEAPRRRAPRWWIGGALAASLTALAIGLPQLLGGGGSSMVYATQDASRTIALADDGGRVVLDQYSQVAMGDGGQLSLDKGAAYFDVRHDEKRPLEIRSGRFAVRDIGTRFSMARSPGRLFVAVEEGLVDISWQGGEPTRLKAGQSFEGEEQGGKVRVSTVDPGSVASWREGRLIYDNTPLTDVATDLSRYMNARIEVDPAVAQLKLSGILLIQNGSDLADQISAILPVDVRRDDQRVRLVARGER
jgi:transmembrane sensor